jgi:hypothetical protein
LLGISDLRITQFAVSSSGTAKGWHGTAQVYVVADLGVLPEHYAVPFFLDFRVNHPKRLTNAQPEELQELTKQLERLGYEVVSVNIPLEGGVQLEIKNPQFRQPA